MKIKIWSPDNADEKDADEKEVPYYEPRDLSWLLATEAEEWLEENHGDYDHCGELDVNIRLVEYPEGTAKTLWQFTVKVPRDRKEGSPMPRVTSASCDLFEASQHSRRELILTGPKLNVCLRQELPLLSEHTLNALARALAYAYIQGSCDKMSEIKAALEIP